MHHGRAVQRERVRKVPNRARGSLSPDDTRSGAELLAPRQGSPKRESGNHPRFFDEQSGSAVGTIDYVRGSGNLTFDVNSPVNSWN